jgi:hypothetical protein
MIDHLGMGDAAVRAAVMLDDAPARATLICTGRKQCAASSGSTLNEVHIAVVAKMTSRYFGLRIGITEIYRPGCLH